MVLHNYQNLKEMTSNIIDIVAFGVGFKCPCKIYLNTQCPPSRIAQPKYTYVRSGDFRLFLVWWIWWSPLALRFFSLSEECTASDANVSLKKVKRFSKDKLSYSSTEIRKTQNELLNIVCQKFEQSVIVNLIPISWFFWIYTTCF